MSGGAWDIYVPLVTGLISTWFVLGAAVLGFNLLHRGAHASDGGSGRYDD